MELFRCILFLAVDVILSVQNLDTGGKLKHFFQLLSFLFCFSLFFIPFFISSGHIWRFHLRGIDFTWENSATRRKEKIFSLPLVSRFALCAKYRVRPGCRDGAVVRAPASHQYGRVRFPGPASNVGWVCWFYSLHREVFSGYSGFPSPQKTNIWIWLDCVNC